MSEALMSPIERRARLALTGVLALYGIRILTTLGDTHRWLDDLDLAIHEAGHLLFAFGGTFLTALGGTLLQLLGPLVFALYFHRRGDRHAVTVLLWWLGQNCWNISVYVRDARSQALPLLGGGEHDWSYLLGELGLLARDQALADLVRLIGVVLYGLSVVLGWMTLRDAPAVKTSDPRP